MNEGEVGARGSSRLPGSMNGRLLVLCTVFIVWSALGLDQFNERWITLTKWWGLLVYILVHLGLVVMILRTIGLRPWAIALCAAGLGFGEWSVLQMFFVFTFWQFGGFN